VFEHKNDLVEGVPSKYKCHRLVYFEQFASITAAIAREKEVKAGAERRRTSWSNP
jgi:putative endonuclease